MPVAIPCFRPGFRLVFLCAAFLPVPGAAAPSAGARTNREAAGGWIILFDGRTLDGWTIAGRDDAEGTCWKVEGGALVCPPGDARPASSRGGSLVTTRAFRDFDLRLEYRLAGPDGGAVNSGIKIFNDPATELGPEFQILSPRPRSPKPGGNTGDLYALMKADYDAGRPNPDGQWNRVRIVAKGDTVEHWLNGVRILAYRRGGGAFRTAVASSKFRNVKPPFGEASEGSILLQDHGGGIALRHIRLRPLDD